MACAAHEGRHYIVIPERRILGSVGKLVDGVDFRRCHEETFLMKGVHHASTSAYGRAMELDCECFSRTPMDGSPTAGSPAGGGWHPVDSAHRLPRGRGARGAWARGGGGGG